MNVYVYIYCFLFSLQSFNFVCQIVFWRTLCKWCQLRGESRRYTVETHIKTIPNITAILSRHFPCFLLLLEFPPKILEISLKSKPIWKVKLIQLPPMLNLHRLL